MGQRRNALQHFYARNSDENMPNTFQHSRPWCCTVERDGLLFSSRRTQDDAAQLSEYFFSTPQSEGSERGPDGYTDCCRCRSCCVILFSAKSLKVVFFQVPAARDLTPGWECPIKGIPLIPLSKLFSFFFVLLTPPVE